TWPAHRIHQRLPLLDIFRPTTKLAAAIEPFGCRRTLRRALEVAAEEPGGPAYLTVSADVSRAEATDPTRPAAAAPPRPVSDPGAAATIVRGRLANAERPLLLVGLGVRPGDAPLLRRWVEEWHLPVAVTPKVKGIVDETHPRFGGVVGGMAIDGVMTEGIRQADLVLGLGLDPTEIDSAWHGEVPMLWILDSAWATGVSPAADVVAADPGALLEDLLGAAAPRTWQDPLTAAREKRRRLLEDRQERGGVVAPLAVVRGLAGVLPAETIVTTDVGSHKFLFGQFWPSRQPQTFFMSNGLSGMGYGLPAAIGAKLARPDQPVLAVLGDGGFSMNSQELETARRLGAPIVVAVLADRSLSMIRLAQRRRGLAPYGVDFDPIDNVLLAEACGVRGCRVDSEASLAAAAREALQRDETTVIEVPIDLEDYVPII
ncbi:MAG: thiamine pyrophosphate-dependent enzyme, partial [Candidatus Dormiibacterota bacterium]